MLLMARLQSAQIFAPACLCQYRARRSFFSTLPTGLRGSEATKSTVFGAITLPSFCLAQRDQFLGADLWPGLSSTTALTASPHFSSGTPITAQSCTAGWLQITCSTSLGIDVEAARDDHVLLAVGDVQVALGVDVADVAGVQPAVDDGLGGLVRLPCSSPS